MGQHHKAKLGPAGRAQLVSVIKTGATFRAAAAAMSVAPATAHRWWWRWQQASVNDRESGRWAWDRSSRPARSPARTSPEDEQRICQARQRTNLGPGRLAGIVGCPRSTVHVVLVRHGISRRRRGQRQTFKRFEWAEPGALLHIDTKRLQRFDRPGHWATGDRHGRHRDVGYVYAHCVVDDHTRLAYIELHGSDTGQAAALTLQRAAAWMRQQGCGPTEAVMSDNAFAYTNSRAFQAALDDLGARHIRIPPYTPRWNGKVERFIQTLDTEWAHSRIWASSAQRDRALSSFLRYYNRRRPHSSLNDRPPISRVHNVPGQDT